MIRRAFKIARSGRPGPVLIDITKDVTEAFADFTPRRPEMIGPRTSTIRDEAVGKAAEMINASERPVLFVGGGAVASNAAAELLELAHKAHIPVCDSLMGKGAFPGNDPLYMGMAFVFLTVIRVRWIRSQNRRKSCSSMSTRLRSIKISSWI